VLVALQRKRSWVNGRKNRAVQPFATLIHGASNETGVLSILFYVYIVTIMQWKNYHRPFTMDRGEARDVHFKPEIGT
jgi:hypothetical protein